MRWLKQLSVKAHQVSWTAKTIQAVDSTLSKVLVWWSYRPPLLVYQFSSKQYSFLSASLLNLWSVNCNMIVVMEVLPFWQSVSQGPVDATANLLVQHLNTKKTLSLFIPHPDKYNQKVTLLSILYICEVTCCLLYLVNFHKVLDFQLNYFNQSCFIFLISYLHFYQTDT